MAPSNIKICVRIRPEQGNERGTQFREVVKAIGDKVVVFDPPAEDRTGLKTIFSSQRNKDLKFSFDSVFGPESSQLDVYRCTTAEVLDDVLNGINCCVFAYGATGAGKTFTMLGSKEHPGVIFKTVMMLYTKIEAIADEYTYDVEVSYVEIYNEKMKDLLSPNRKLVLSEGSDGIIQLRGVSLHNPTCAEELLEMLVTGNKERTQSPTAANEESSRSHAIFQIYLRGRPKVSGTTNTWKHAKFSLIDLAGSEKGSVTRNSKQQREGSNINRSLLALGNCINALADRKKNPKIFVPYRDSKLTRLLKDSLGGSCQTIMIANVSPSSKSYEDTYNTLKYANRAKNIKVELVENVVQVRKHVGEYDDLVKELKAEISSLNNKLKQKNATAEKLKMLEEFNTKFSNFDKMCRDVFQERAQLKKELTVLEGEEHNLATTIRQNESYLRIIASFDPKSPLLILTQCEIDTLSDKLAATHAYIHAKKEDINRNMETSDGVQREIHEYIQRDSTRIPKPLGPELLVQLWEFHLVKVQSYYTGHSVSTLQEALQTSERQNQHMTSIVESVFQVLSGNENISEEIRDQLSSVCVKLTQCDKKREGVVWADDAPQTHPTSNLFPSPKLVQPRSPVLSFTPGKTLVGSTPQLNKLQAAHVHGAGFSTPAPTKLQECFKARFAARYEIDKSKININLADRFDTKPKSVKPILKESRPRTKSEETDGSCTTEDLNSTFTLDEPTKLVTKPRIGGKRKQSMIPPPATHQPKRNALVSPFPKSLPVVSPGSRVGGVRTSRPANSRRPTAPRSTSAPRATSLPRSTSSSMPRLKREVNPETGRPMSLGVRTAGSASSQNGQSGQASQAKPTQPRKLVKGTWKR